MEECGGASGTGKRGRLSPGRTDTASRHFPRGGRRTDHNLTKVRPETRRNQIFSRGRHGRPSDRRFTFPRQKSFYGSDDFADDGLPQHGCFDFGPRGESERPRRPRWEEQEDQHGDVRKPERKFRKNRRRAPNAVSTSLELGIMEPSENRLTAEKQQQEGRKRKDRPSHAHEPEFKIPKTSGDHNDSAHMTELSEKEEALTASEPVAEAPKNRAERHIEEIHEKRTPVPVSTWPSLGRSYKRNPKKKKKQTWVWKPVPRITAQRMAFTCPVCKFRSFYRTRLSEHLRSTFHKEHFTYLMEHLPKATVHFLKGHFNEKQNSVETFINHLENHRDAVCQLYEERDLTRDISMENFIRKAEAAHCVACNMYIPMAHYLIQKHLSSPDHKQNCRIMMVESKQMGLSTANSILNQQFVKKKLDLYLKNSMVTKRPEVNTDTLDEDVDVMRRDQVTQTSKATRNGQEGELLCERVIIAEGELGDGKDREEETYREQIINAEEDERIVKDPQTEACCDPSVHAVEVVGERKDQEGEPVPVTPIRAIEVVNDKKDQEGEPSSVTPIRAIEVVNDKKDQEGEPSSVLPFQAVEVVSDKNDQEGELFSVKPIRAIEVVNDDKDQEGELFSVKPIRAVEMVSDKNDQEGEPSSVTPFQAVKAVNDRTAQEGAPFCVTPIPALEAVNDRTAQEGAPFCVTPIPALEAVNDRTAQEGEPFCVLITETAKDRMVEPFYGLSDQTVSGRKGQEAESLPDWRIEAKEGVREQGKTARLVSPVWEEPNPGAAIKRNKEVESRDLNKLLFSLLDEEEDMEGVELGEEEQEESDYL